MRGVLMLLGSTPHVAAGGPKATIGVENINPWILVFITHIC